jgi:hypothetical protein
MVFSGNHEERLLMSGRPSCFTAYSISLFTSLCFTLLQFVLLQWVLRRLRGSSSHTVFCFAFAALRFISLELRLVSLSASWILDALRTLAHFGLRFSLRFHYYFTLF